jgi:hypothetical protein
MITKIAALKMSRCCHRVLLTLAVTVLGMTTAQAGTVRYESEIHSGNSFMAFYNHTSSDRDIIQIIVQLGAGAFFDPNDAVMALGSSSPSRPISVAHFDPAWNAISTNSDVGLVGGLSADSFSTDRKTATFNFNDFDAGEAWGVWVDFDTLNSQTNPTGPAMNGVMVSVLFAGGITLTSSCSDPFIGAGDECHPATYGGKKGSFPSSNSAEYANDPEPVTAVLLGSGLVALHMLRARKSAKK